MRWSCNGSLLASGGDDKIIMIWKRSNGPSSVFGATGIIKASENWRTHNTLRGHSGRNIQKHRKIRNMRNNMNFVKQKLYR